MNRSNFIVFLAFVLSGCVKQHPIFVTRETKKWSETLQDLTPNSGGPKIVYLIRDAKDPSDTRILNQAEDAAIEDHTHLYAYIAPTASSLRSALAAIQQLPAKGLVVVSPQTDDAKIVETWVKGQSTLVLSLNDQLAQTDHSAPMIPAFICDAKSVGEGAVKAMASEAKHMHWNLAGTGVILFSSRARGAYDAFTNAELASFKQMGLRSNSIYRCQLTKPSLGEARDAAKSVMKEERADVSKWFIAGANDLTVVGGLRASEDVRVGLDRTIGVGIGGDGAVYDLQRPRPSGLKGSILLPLDKMSSRAEHAMARWIAAKTPPFGDSSFRGVYLNRQNVRELKASNHLVN